MIYIIIFFWGSNVKERVVDMKITGLKKAVGDYQRANKKAIIVLDMVILCLIKKLENCGQMNFIL